MFKKNLILLSVLLVSTIAQGAEGQAAKGKAAEPTMSQLFTNKAQYQTKVYCTLPQPNMLDVGVTFFNNGKMSQKAITQEGFRTLQNGSPALRQEAKFIIFSLACLGKTPADLPA